MKKNLLSLMLLSLLLVSCQTTTTDVSTSSSASDTTDTSSSHTHIDYTTEEAMRLTLDYTGHSFWEDGIEQVTEGTCIDGDTVHFKTLTGQTLKARFYGIDTPESTGTVEDWGEDAHRFTEEKITEALANGTVVVSSPSTEYGAPQTDSTGSRYVSLVWISLDTKNCPYDQLILLNLLIVQNGLSYVKNVSSIPAYEEYFYAAEQQAKEEKLCLFSGEHSQYYNAGDYIDTSLLDIKKELELSLTDSSHVNAYNNQKVRIVGTVAGYSNNTLYIENYYSVDDGGRYDYGEYAGINIFTGMGTIATKYTKTNTYIQVCGLCQDSELFGFQVTDTQFNAYPQDDDTKNARVKIKAADNTDEYALNKIELAPSAVYEKKFEVLNCAVTLTEPVKVTGGYMSEDGDATLYLADKDGNSLGFDAYIPFKYHSTIDDTLYDEITDFEGKWFNVDGVLTFHKTTSGNIRYQMTMHDNTGFAETEEPA